MKSIFSVYGIFFYLETKKHGEGNEGKIKKKAEKKEIKLIKEI